jgi:ATP-dependent RNA helicase DDX49/DBP8
MAPSKDDTKSEDSYPSEDSDMNQPDTNDRASKRRRLSESDEEDDEYVAPAPLPTVSRIKKKDETKKPEPTEEEDPVTIRDALEIGLRAEESTFGALNVSPWLVGSLTTMAIRRPTAIQKACIPEILKGRDCIGGSRTGSGKTMAFAVPIIQKWAQDPFGIFALVLTPTRYVQFALMDGFHNNKRAYTNIFSLIIAESWLFRSSSNLRLSPRHRA